MRMFFSFILGTDERAIINILGFRNAKQREEINVKFQQMFGKVNIVFGVSVAETILVL